METVELSNLEKQEEQLEIRKKTSKNLLWVGILSIIMLFAGLTSAYIVRQAEGQWLVFDLPNAFYLSTLFILLSSGGLIWANRSAKSDNFDGVKMGLMLTFVLGLAFSYFQFEGWSQLRAQDVFFAGKESNAAGSFMYVITGLHLAHLFAGFLSLIYTFAQSTQGKYNSDGKLGLELCSLYWHFLGLLWVYLFFFLLYIR
ncbi:cytochrome c oxidase subunit 3 [Salibacteraceae bacterium]|jgi:cytochrome c oxidase subunit 3|nr:cytochrome oxidase subunit III [Crocinitomicaceae bacterium]MCH9822829.1 cytochrome c oxidase subunit 3 [Bacteroidota bacterium]MDA7730303.1 cytochrome c oxidase subunit 3 [Salibacteraceae bacterium]MDB9724810.1 cytochrome c oxidase subunit 3 [Salibacteraceae bacterium]|tara:strand:+ start:50503 stop:51102 length:600 start_codon:yes stop_codon:yes gene_type:complete